MRRSSLRLMLIALGWAGSALIVSSASAHDAAYDSKVTIHNPQSGVYRGVVSSDKGACIGGRRVNLWQSRPGPDQLVADDRTDPEGRWRIALVGAHYYAEVVRKVVERPGHRHVCRGDVSRTI